MAEQPPVTDATPSDGATDDGASGTALDVRPTGEQTAPTPPKPTPDGPPPVVSVNPGPMEPPTTPETSPAPTKPKVIVNPGPTKPPTPTQPKI